MVWRWRCCPCEAQEHAVEVVREDEHGAASVAPVAYPAGKELPAPQHAKADGPEHVEASDTDRAMGRENSNMQRQRACLRVHGFESHSMSDAFGLYDVDLHLEPGRRDNIARYYKLCMDTDVLVTLSCFSIWSENKKRNDAAKIIPVLPTSARPGRADAGHDELLRTPSRVFFFDDNIDFQQGGASGSGICNLRNALTGEFVDFSEGRNGFKVARAGRHTLLHHSTDYRAVLVKANIMDAMEDEAYFTKILTSHSLPGEKLLVYVDVNSTIVCVDTVTDKSMVEILLSTLFEFVEVSPRGEPFDFTWDGRERVKVDKAMTFKQLVKKIAKNDQSFYTGFYEKERCERFFERLAKTAHIKWTTHDAPLTLKEFTAAYEQYLVIMSEGSTDMGITRSWFNMFEFMRKSHHPIVLNSFGVDTRKVIAQTVPNAMSVMHITVNYKQWDARDKTKFEDEYGVKCKRESRLEADAKTRERMQALVRRATSELDGSGAEVVSC